MRVTFDTHTLDPITQPDLAGSMRAECMTIHESLQSKRLAGFFCETILTVEGQPPREGAFARVQRALGVAAHHSYANDLFCTQDRAVRAGRDSVMHPANRGWLRRVYGVEFVDIAELAARLERFD